MNRQRWQRVKTVFAHASEIEPRTLRRAYLQKACRGSPSLRVEIESLLSNRERSSPLLAGDGLQPGACLLHYELLKKIGEGSMGIVYKARDTHLYRVVALKILAPLLAMDTNARARFLREARCASALSHPNIVAVHDIAQDKGVCFIVMEYLLGKGLHRVIPKNGIPLPRCLALAIPIADALAKAHAAGIIHRDLKPGNILVNSDGLIKIVDFGLAKDITSRIRYPLERTHPGTILGTVGYMSPEQVQGRKADARSDIFAFGAVFYEMLTGKRAFQRQSLLATLKAIETANPRMPRNAPTDVLRLLERCLKKDPNTRFQTMREVADALKTLSSGG